MFWIITGVVVVVLVAAAWLVSARSKRVSHRVDTDRTSNPQLAEHTIRQNTGQFPGGQGT